jgi:gamma-D-glutamyl-L-lysine dipeptidyl-peptidase
MRTRYFVIVSLILFLLPVLALGQMRWVTSQPVVNMFSQPSTDADVVSQTIYGITVQQIPADAKTKVPDGWMHIKTPDDYTGWVQRIAYLPLDVKETYAGTDKKVVTVANRAANIYRETDVTKHAPVMTLPFESPLELVGSSDKDPKRWLKVKLTSGEEVWVQRGDVDDRTGKPFTLLEAINLAKHMMGVTYTWGGTSSFGYDCSGFTQMLMRQQGIVMPRDADIQATWSGLETVKREELKPGDLLYFGGQNKKVTHTGMYIGNGEFIHDTTHDHPMVQISRLDDQPWTKLLLACRRAKTK